MISVSRSPENSVHTAIPSGSIVPQKISRIRSVFSTIFSFVSTQVCKTPERVITVCRVTTSVAAKTVNVGFKVCLSLEEASGMFDTDPTLSIKKADHRLKALSDLQFTQFCYFLSKKGSALYESNEGKIKAKISSKVLVSLLEKYRGLMIQTIEANILNLCANLLEKANLHQETLEIGDHRTTDPLNKIIALIAYRSRPYLITIQAVEARLVGNKQELLITLFKAWSEDLLRLIFPNKSKDIKFFIRLPVIHLLQEKIWEILNEQLTKLLMNKYEEILPTIKGNEHPDWQKEFEECVKVEGAQQIVKLPSYFFKSWIKSCNKTKFLQRKIEKGLSQKVIADPVLRGVAVKSITHLLKTKNPEILKLGSFVESYMMQKCLRHLFQTTKQDGSFLPILFQKSVTIAKKLETFQLEEQSPIILKDVLHLFGFETQSTAPLPPILGNLFWSMLEKGKEKSLPNLFKENIQGFLPYLVNRERYKQEIDELIGDASLTITISEHVHAFIEKGIRFLISKEGQLLCGESPRIKLTDLTVTQKKQVEHQILTLLKTDSSSLNSMKHFVSVYIESIVYHSIINHYYRFKEHTLQNPAEAVLGSNHTKFVPWMVTQLKDLFQDLSIQHLAPEDIAILKQSIALKNRIPLITNVEEKSKQEAVLESLWKSSIYPVFRKVNTRLLTFLGFSKPEQLPVPIVGQKILWNLMISKLPRVLFDQSADMMIPFIEKEDYREHLRAIPKGDFIIRACNTLTQDLISVLPYWCIDCHYLAKEFNESYLGGALSSNELAHVEADLSQMIKEYNTKSKSLLAIIKRYAPQTTIFTVELEKDLRAKLETFKDRLESVFFSPRSMLEEVRVLPFSSQFKDLLASHMHSFIQQGSTDFNPIWSFLGGYVEGIFLKIAVKASELDSRGLEEIKNQLLKLKHDLTNASSLEVKIVLNGFVERLFKWGDITSDSSIYGIPRGLNKVILSAAKSVIVDELSRYYGVVYKLKNLDVTKCPTVEGLSISALSQAILSTTRFHVEANIDKLNEVLNKQKGKIQHSLSETFPVLDNYNRQNIRTAGLFKEFIQEGTPARWIEIAFDGLQQNDNQRYAKPIAEFLRPVLLERTLKLLDPLLLAERQGQAKFDQKILLTLLPILTDHFKHMNRASAMSGGIDRENFIIAANEQLHDAIPIEGNEQEQLNYKIKHFYQPQAKKLLGLIFPNGRKDLEKLFPDLDARMRTYIWRLLKKSIELSLPKMVETMFQTDVLDEVITNTFEEMIQNLSKPIDLSESEVRLTREDLQRHEEIDRMAGQFIMEGARFLKFPIDRIEKWPNLLKKVVFLDPIKAKTYEAVGKSFRKQFDGKFILESVQKALPKLAEKAYSKLSPAEEIEHRRRVQEQLKQMERQLVKVGLSYIVRLFGAKIERYLSQFNSRIGRGIAQAFITSVTFIIMKILWPIAKRLKLDQKIEENLYQFVDQSRGRFMYAFKDPRIQENVIFRSLDGLSRA